MKHLTFLFILLAFGLNAQTDDYTQSDYASYSGNNHCYVYPVTADTIMTTDTLYITIPRAFAGRMSVSWIGVDTDYGASDAADAISIKLLAAVCKTCEFVDIATIATWDVGEDIKAATATSSTALEFPWAKIRVTTEAAQTILNGYIVLKPI